MYRRLAAAVATAALTTLALASAGAPARAAAADTDTATSWLTGQQQGDGGFEVSGFPGFETPDAVLAIAAHAQTSTTWSTAEAFAAVDALEAGAPGGPTPLDALDDFAESGLVAGQAAKLVALVTAPLGLDPTSFDPGADGSAVDLVAVIDAGLDAGSYGAFNATLFAVIANSLLGRAVPAESIDLIKSGQMPGGGWSFDGLATDDNAAEVDTTGFAVVALVASGATAADAAVAAALGFLAGAHTTAGGWENVFNPEIVDPNSTAISTLAITSAGWDVAERAWRDSFAPERCTDGYTSPDSALADLQNEAGRFESPNDQWGVNTFPTSQAIQALERNWFPRATQLIPADDPCADPDPGAGDPSDPVNPDDPEVDDDPEVEPDPTLETPEGSSDTPAGAEADQAQTTQTGASSGTEDQLPFTGTGVPVAPVIGLALMATALGLGVVRAARRHSGSRG